VHYVKPGNIQDTSGEARSIVFLEWIESLQSISPCESYDFVHRISEIYIMPCESRPFHDSKPLRAVLYHLVRRCSLVNWWLRTVIDLCLCKIGAIYVLSIPNVVVLAATLASLITDQFPLRDKDCYHSQFPVWTKLINDWLRNTEPNVGMFKDQLIRSLCIICDNFNQCWTY